MGYDLQKDYNTQLKELQEKEYNLPTGDVAPNKARVELFYFDPRDEEEAGAVYIPKQTIIGATEKVTTKDMKKGKAENHEFAGARAIVRVIELGDYRSDVPEYEKIAESVESGVKLFRVPAEEVEGSVISVEFLTFMKNSMEENTATGKNAFRTPLPERVPSWQQEWKKYRYTNPIDVRGFTNEFLFEIPFRKLEAPIKL